MKKNRALCLSTVLSGPRAGLRCGNFATCVIVVMNTAEPCCGTHARAYLPTALARLAYYDERSRSWP
jgi:hypothetical protein